MSCTNSPLYMVVPPNTAVALELNCRELGPARLTFPEGIGAIEKDTVFGFRCCNEVQAINITTGHHVAVSEAFEVITPDDFHFHEHDEIWLKLPCIFPVPFNDARLYEQGPNGKWQQRGSAQAIPDADGNLDYFKLKSINPQRHYAVGYEAH